MRTLRDNIYWALSTLAPLCAAQMAGAQNVENGGMSRPVSDGRSAQQEFEALLSRVLPRNGSFIAVYEPVKAKAYGRTTIGFDAATKAWFHAGWSGEMAGIGQDPEGHGFASGTRKGSARPYDPWPPSPLPVATNFPTATLYYLAEHSEAIRHTQHEADGTWVVSWDLPAVSGRTSPTQIIVVSADGLPTKRWQEDPKDRREEIFEFAGNSPPEFPILAGRAPPTPVAPGRGTALVHVEFFSEGNASVFSRESVAETCFDNSVIVQMKERAQAAGLSDDNDPSKSGEPSVVSFTGRQWSRLRWPLVVAGAILVLLAAIEVYRRRSV